MKNKHLIYVVSFIVIFSVCLIPSFKQKDAEINKIEAIKEIKLKKEKAEEKAQKLVSDEGLKVITVEINSWSNINPDDEVNLVHITDTHINYCDEVDFKENNLSTMSTYKQRGWLANGESMPMLDRALKYGSYYDQTVITGDILDYISHGSMEMARTHIWEKYPDVLCALGNHDHVRVMNLPEDVPDPTSNEERLELIQSIWPHNIYYTSKVIKNKVMAVQLYNGLGTFLEQQYKPFKSDLEKARKNGYTVLLFYHIPLPQTLKKGQSPIPDDTSAKIYELITDNSDIIGGAFCGHIHNSTISAIYSYDENGEYRPINQYTLITNSCNNGNVIKITVK